jgi:hypothetical protein
MKITLELGNLKRKVVLKNTIFLICQGLSHPWDEGLSHALVNLVTALVPSDTACLASSPGKIRRTAV